ncbi:Wzz/FepE/Etk N-terminal domain-containing protein [Gammaproteobacteria bacterium]|nr:Wzz/FepE/Etk N-terminal domain-containing protein [Gammaproteobacteria bacterium]
MENSSHSEQLINFKELFSILWDAKYWISLSVSIFGVFSLFYALSLPNIYLSESLLRLSTQSSQSNSSPFPSQFGSLASMAGINLGSSGNDISKINTVLSTIQSRDFLKRLLEVEWVLPGLMALESYDPETKKIIYNSSIYNSDENKWIREVPNNRSQIPSFQEVLPVYQGTIRVFYNKQTSHITIGVSHQSPIFAYKFLSLIIDEVNSFNRMIAIENAEKSLAYLYEQISIEKRDDISLTIESVIEQQLQQKMLAEVNKDFLIQPIDSPYIPEMKNAPVRAQLCVLITLFGGIISCLFFVLKYYYFTRIER